MAVCIFCDVSTNAADEDDDAGEGPKLNGWLMVVGMCSVRSRHVPTLDFRCNCAIRDCTLASTLKARAREGAAAAKALAEVAAISREVPLGRRVGVFDNICEPNDEDGE